MSLGQALIGVAKDIPHPTDVNRTLWDARYDVGPYAGQTGEGDDEGREEHYRGVVNLGSGNDYAVFLHHLGVSEQPTFQA
jgi:N-acetylated-alpha-linked acidic dipeptidase